MWLLKSDWSNLILAVHINQVYSSILWLHPIKLNVVSFYEGSFRPILLYHNYIPYILIKSLLSKISIRVFSGHFDFWFILVYMQCRIYSKKRFILHSIC